VGERFAEVRRHIPGEHGARAQAASRQIARQAMQIHSGEYGFCRISASILRQAAREDSCEDIA
jgi:hypothetical protein